MTLSASLDAGLNYLWSKQSPEGYWSDWSLPPGESRMWTTAYVGYRLSSLPVPRRDAIQPHLLRAMEWLRAAELPRGGWGYSEETGMDADSTALAILFIRALGGPVPERAVLRLCEHQQPDGGFSTYTDEAAYGSWIQSQPEVTAVATLALLSIPAVDTSRVDRALVYLSDQQRADGFWNSFWWTSCFYSTEAALALLNRPAEPLDARGVRTSLCREEPSTALDSALKLLCLIRAGAESSQDETSVPTLLGSQLPDGSWPSAAILRLTPRHCRQPWNADDSAPRFADEQRVFTTATVVAALGALEQIRERAARQALQEVG